MLYTTKFKVNLNILLKNRHVFSKFKHVLKTKCIYTRPKYVIKKLNYKLIKFQVAMIKVCINLT